MWFPAAAWNALHQYDIVVVDSDVDFHDVKVGDIIVFERPEGGDRTILHRVISIDIDPDGSRVLTTKGDANPSPIPGTDYPITEDLYLGKSVSIIPKLGFVTQVLAPPVNYIITMGIWAGIIYALYKRWKRQKPTESGKDTLMSLPEVHDAANRAAAGNKLTIKKVLRDQTIYAEGGRDFKWSWMIAAIIFAWPASIAYYFTSKKNSVSVTITPKTDSLGSHVSIRSMGRKGNVAASDLHSLIQ
jgi:signal peptidase I